VGTHHLAHSWTAHRASTDTIPGTVQFLPFRCSSSVAGSRGTARDLREGG